MNNRGFTLIELVLVMAIIGILAAVALPAYQDYTVRARLSEALALADEGKRAVAEYYDRWGRLPLNNAAAGMHRPEAYRTQNVTAITVNGGVVEVGVQTTFGAAARGKIYLRPAINRAYPSGALLWMCNGSGRLPEGFELVGTLGQDVVLAKYLPGSCR